jgi:hypothetical protein
MSAPTIGRRRGYQPPPDAEIDSDHFLAAGFCGMFWGSPPISTQGIHVSTGGSALAHALTEAGPAATGAGTGVNQGFRGFPPAVNISALRPSTLAAVVNVTSTSEQGVFVGLNAPTTNAGFGLGVGNTTIGNAGNNLVGIHGNVADKNSAIAIGTGVHAVAMSASGTADVFYIDGVQVASLAAATFVTTAPIQLCGFAQRTSTGSLSSGVQVILGAAWNRELSAAEVLYFAKSPYQVLRF